MPYTLTLAIAIATLLKSKIINGVPIYITTGQSIKLPTNLLNLQEPYFTIVI